MSDLEQLIEQLKNYNERYLAKTGDAVYKHPEIINYLSQLVAANERIKELEKAQEWISVESYKDLPIGTWQVAMIDKNGEVLTELAKVKQGGNSLICVIGGHFAFDYSDRVYAYKQIDALPPQPKE